MAIKVFRPDRGNIDWEFELKLVKRPGNELPYFALTGDKYKTKKNGQRIRLDAGCLHEDFKELFPEEVLLTELHLSDIKGVPLYAYTNGLYFARHPEKYSLEDLRKHLRLSRVGEAAEYFALAEKYNTAESMQLAERYAQQFSDLVWSHRDRWKAEADEVIAKYNLHVVEEK